MKLTAPKVEIHNFLYCITTRTTNAIIENDLKKFTLNFSIVILTCYMNKTLTWNYGTKETWALRVNVTGSTGAKGNGNSNSSTAIMREQYNLPDFQTKYECAAFYW